MRSIRPAIILGFLFVIGATGCDSPGTPDLDDDGGDDPDPVPVSITLVYPPDGASAQSRRPVFYWAEDIDEPGGTDIAWYRLRIRETGAADWDTWGDIEESPCSYPFAADLEARTTYQWHVEFVDDEQLGDPVVATCNPVSFTTGDGTNNPPLPPHDPNPVDDESDIGETQTLAWLCEDPDGDPLLFDVHLGPTGSEALVSEDQSAVSWDAASLAPETEYTWWIVASDDRGGVTESPHWRFSTVGLTNRSPDAPEAVYPPAGATGIPVEITLEWSCSDPDGDPLVYDVFYYRWDSGPPGMQIADGITETTLSAGFLELTRYAWRIVATDDGGLSSEATFDFTTAEAENHPPNETVPVYPAPDAVDIPVDLVIEWSCSDPDGDPLVYDVFFGRWSPYDVVQVADDQAATTYAVSGLEYGTEYAWKIIPSDDGGLTNPSTHFVFTTMDEPEPYAGVFAILTLGRSILYDGENATRIDNISARFDSVYDPCSGVIPLRPDAVSASSFDLVWDESFGLFFYSDYIAGFFLNPGTQYTFDVTGGGKVPDLVESIVFPTCECYVTSPAPFAFVDRSGFDIEWQTTCGGMIDIVLVDLNSMDSTGVFITTENDGSFTLTGDYLDGLDPMVYQLQIVLVKQARHAILAAGYDPRSWIWARVLSTQMVYLNP